MDRTNNHDLPILNGLSLDSITIHHDGELKVVFDLPMTQTTAAYRQDLQGVRVLDLNEDPELQRLCRDLFQAIRARVQEPDSRRVETSCDRCGSAGCCRNYNVLVTAKDIERLSAGLGMRPEEFEEKCLLPAVDWTEDYLYQLACDRDAKGEKCIFLKPAGAGGWRCSVYEHRPQICRAFDVATCEDFVPLESVRRFG